MGRPPGLSVRLKLTLSYAGFLMVAGFLMLAAAWLAGRPGQFFDILRYVPDSVISTLGALVPGHRAFLLRAYAPSAAVALAFLLLFGLVGGWLLAGRMLAPLIRITEATRKAANGSLSHRIRLPGRKDEFRELADAFDTMLERVEAHVGEQRRFAANASHELRTPLAITQTLLDVARNDPDRETGELVDRLHVINTRAIDLTEALLVLSRADQGSFRREHVDLSLLAEEATETLLPLAEKRGLSIETCGDVTPTIGSQALLLQMATNLVHNAIVHNLPERGAVWVTTSVQPRLWRSPSRTLARRWRQSWCPRWWSRFSVAPNASAPTTPALASDWRLSRASLKPTAEPSPLLPDPLAGSASRCNYPPHQTGQMTIGDSPLAGMARRDRGAHRSRGGLECHGPISQGPWKPRMRRYARRLFEVPALMGRNQSIAIQHAIGICATNGDTMIRCASAALSVRNLAVLMC